MPSNPPCVAAFVSKWLASRSRWRRCETALVASIRRDVERVKIRDRNFGGNQAVLRARMLAVTDAQRAIAARETGARYALRQSLIDLAAVAELVAGDLPVPRAPAGWPALRLEYRPLRREGPTGESLALTRRVRPR